MSNQKSMTDAQIQEVIIGILDNLLGLDNLEGVTLESTLEEIGMDSLDQVELIVELENRLDIEIPDEQAETWTTMYAVVSGVRQALNK